VRRGAKKTGMNGTKMISTASPTHGRFYPSSMRCKMPRNCAPYMPPRNLQNALKPNAPPVLVTSNAAVSAVCSLVCLCVCLVGKSKLDARA
jgi:hypothetical protein